ncbi:MAG: hypothetical protein V4671_02600 [Armatimonadota bacterium]
MIQWWRELNRYGPVLWAPFALVGHLGGRAALCYLALALLKMLLHVTLSRAGQIACVIAVWIVSWAPFYVADLLKVDPIKQTWADVCLGWLWVVIAVAVYAAAALMGH